MPFRPDAVVLRGGLSTIQTLLINAEDTYDDEGTWGVSAWIADELSVADLLDDLADVLPHSKIRWTNIQRLEDGGFRVSASGQQHHVTIHLNGDPKDDENQEIERLEALFEPAVERFYAGPGSRSLM